MVSFFGLKIGSEKKRKPEKDEAAEDARYWRKFDQNEFGQGQYFGHEASAASGSGRGGPRPGTAQSMRPGRSPYDMNTHNQAASSMYDLSHVSHRREGSYASLKARKRGSAAKLGTNFGNGSSLSLAPPTIRAGVPNRPSSSQSHRNKPWVSPLDIHFQRTPSPAPPPSSGPKSPLGQFELQVSTGNDETYLLGDKPERVAQAISNQVNGVTKSPMTPSPPNQQPAPIQIADARMSPRPYPSPPQSLKGGSSGLDRPYQSVRREALPDGINGPAALPSPPISQTRVSEDQALGWAAPPIIQNVMAKRDTFTIAAGPRRQSLSMKIEELEKTLVKEQQRALQAQSSGATTTTTTTTTTDRFPQPQTAEITSGEEEEEDDDNEDPDEPLPLQIERIPSIPFTDSGSRPSSPATSLRGPQLPPPPRGPMMNGPGPRSPPMMRGPPRSESPMSRGGARMHSPSGMRGSPRHQSPMGRAPLPLPPPPRAPSPSGLRGPGTQSPRPRAPTVGGGRPESPAAMTGRLPFDNQHQRTQSPMSSSGRRSESSTTDRPSPRTVPRAAGPKPPPLSSRPPRPAPEEYGNVPRADRRVAPAPAPAPLPQPPSQPAAAAPFPKKTTTTMQHRPLDDFAFPFQKPTTTSSPTPPPPSSPPTSALPALPPSGPLPALPMLAPLTQPAPRPTPAPLPTPDTPTPGRFAFDDSDDDDNDNDPNVQHASFARPRPRPPPLDMPAPPPPKPAAAAVTSDWPLPSPSALQPPRSARMPPGGGMDFPRGFKGGRDGPVRERERNNSNNDDEEKDKRNGLFRQQAIGGGPWTPPLRVDSIPLRDRDDNKADVDEAKRLGGGWDWDFEVKREVVRPSTAGGGGGGGGGSGSSSGNMVGGGRGAAGGAGAGGMLGGFNFELGIVRSATTPAAMAGGGGGGSSSNSPGGGLGGNLSAAALGIGMARGPSIRHIPEKDVTVGPKVQGQRRPDFGLRSPTGYADDFGTSFI